MIYILKIDDKYYVPIGVEGVEISGNGQSGKTSDNNSNSTKIEIVHAGHIYSTLSDDCLDWPSDEISSSQNIEIVYAGHIYSTLPDDCLN